MYYKQPYGYAVKEYPTTKIIKRKFYLMGLILFLILTTYALYTYYYPDLDVKSVKCYDKYIDIELFAKKDGIAFATLVSISLNKTVALEKISKQFKENETINLIVPVENYKGLIKISINGEKFKVFSCS